MRFMEKANVDPSRLMMLVAKNVKKGAQFTPQGVLRYPLASSQPQEVLMEIRLLLDELELEDVPVAGKRLANPQHCYKLKVGMRMMKPTMAGAAIMLGLMTLSGPTADAVASPTGEAAAQSFAALADQYWDQAYFKYAPTNGTLAGFHQYDTQLEDYSRAGIDAEVTTLHEFEKKVCRHS